MAPHDPGTTLRQRPAGGDGLKAAAAGDANAAVETAPALSEAEKEALVLHLDLKKYRGHWSTSLLVAANTIWPMALIWYAFSRLDGGGGFALRGALSLVWGCFVVRSFIVFHDCGHGSFIQGFKGATRCNWVMKQLFAFLAGTPTDWNKGHALHHGAVGNMDQDDYDWGETIFHTVSEFKSWPKWKQVVVGVFRWPPIFFAIAAAATWYVKMRLPFNMREGRKANYRFTDKLVNTLAFATRYYFAWRMGALGAIVAGDYIAMTGGVLLFHFQHVYNPAYVIQKGDKNWNRFDASIIGSSILEIPEVRWGVGGNTLYTHSLYICGVFVTVVMGGWGNIIRAVWGMECGMGTTPHISTARVDEHTNLTPMPKPGVNILYIMTSLPFRLQWLKWVTVGIEYHHIHHFRIRMPGYALRSCHEEAPQEWWRGVTVLDAKDMWDSAWMSIYDDKHKCYTSFPNHPEYKAPGSA